MTEEGLNAAILRLQSLAIETFGRIKDIYRREQQDEDVDQIASLSMKLANYEGALLTLQQYKQGIINSALVTQQAPEEQQEQVDDVILDEAPPIRDGTISGEQLLEKSETLRRAKKLKSGKSKK